MLRWAAIAYYDNAPNHDWTARACHTIQSANLSSDKREPDMTDTPEYTPPEVWVWEKNDMSRFWHEADLPTDVKSASQVAEPAWDISHVRQVPVDPHFIFVSKLH